MTKSQRAIYLGDNTVVLNGLTLKKKKKLEKIKKK